MNLNNLITINFIEKFAKFSEYWSPKILTQFDNYYIKAAKMKGEFVWHSHKDVDEVFIVPKGIEHKPIAEDEVHCLIIEQAGTLNTGDHGGDKTVTNEKWI